MSDAELKQRILYATSAMCVIFAGFAPLHAQAKATRTAEENAIIVALIDSVYHHESAIKLMERTSDRANGGSFAHFAVSLKESLGSDSSAFSDFVTANESPRSLADVKLQKVKFEIISAPIVSESIGAIWKSGERMVTVSRPGFNADRTVAIIEVFLMCGRRCGHGGVYILRKTDGVWRIIGNPIISVS